MSKQVKSVLLESDINRLIQIKQYLDLNFHEKINETILANTFGLSRSTLKRHFHLHFAKSIYSYLLDLRMKKGMELLLARSGTVNQISSLVGYSDASSFTHKFCKFFGFSPAHVLRTDREPIKHEIEPIKHEIDLFKQTTR